MAFPTATARTESALTTAGTSFTVNFSQTTGELVVVFLINANPSTVTLSDSFVNWTNSNDRLHLFYKVLDGSEGGNVVVTQASSKSAAIAYNITGFESGPVLSKPSTFASLSGTNLDPGGLSPGVGAKDFLWIAMISIGGVIEEADDDTWCNSAPTDFTNLLQKTSGTGGAATSNSMIATAELPLNASLLFPGTFNVDQSFTSGSGAVIAVHPVPSAPGVPRGSTQVLQLLAH